MLSQITCPNCQMPFMADIHQIIDVGQSPDMKQFLLSGYLNAAKCPACDAVTQVTTPILYHDPAHELFLIHIPIELNLQYEEQEKLIGQLMQRTMDRLPSDQRRGYMLQPQMVMSMETLLEMVLETEGITKEMIEHQKKQTELLQNLIDVEGEYQTELIKQNESQIDESFFAMLRSMLEMADSMDDTDQSLKLINLQAKLYKNTVYGKKLEKQQQALKQFGREVKSGGVLSPKLLLKHVLANRHDEEVINALIVAGQSAFNYEFFILLTEKIEKRQKSGLNAEELIKLRTKLLEIQDEMERQSKAILSGVQGLLQEIIEAEDRREAVRSNLAKIDTIFMNILSSLFSEAKQIGDSKTANDLMEIQGIIIEEIENQAPPEIRLINQLLRTENEEERIRLINDNRDLLNFDLLALAESIKEDARRSGEGDLAKRADKVESMVRAQLLFQG
ncbi:MAG: hypothetical protein BMS9Abin02_0377 [Anaerolineae bacterium]|nr:MAG: hypothetical protein BMS9Abin02_0377 [Anaerolineae bacterium]